MLCGKGGVVKECTKMENIDSVRLGEEFVSWVIRWRGIGCTLVGDMGACSSGSASEYR